MVDIITVPKYLCHKWPRICSICRNQNPVLSPEITIVLSALPWFTAYYYFVSSTFSLWYIYVFTTTTESPIPLLVDYQFPRCRPPSSQYFDSDIVLVIILYDKSFLIRVHNLFSGIDSVWYALLLEYSLLPHFTPSYDWGKLGWIISSGVSSTQ